jgi:hypothetical protein
VSLQCLVPQEKGCGPFGKRKQCQAYMSIGKTDEISRTLHLMHRWFLVLTKSFKNKCVILRQELTENNLRNGKLSLIDASAA